MNKHNARKTNTKIQNETEEKKEKSSRTKEIKRTQHIKILQFCE